MILQSVNHPTTKSYHYRLSYTAGKYLNFSFIHYLDHLLPGLLAVVGRTLLGTYRQSQGIVSCPSWKNRITYAGKESQTNLRPQLLVS
jgi:hypothetical protein